LFCHETHVLDRQTDEQNFDSQDHDNDASHLAIIQYVKTEKFYKHNAMLVTFTLNW